MMTVPASSPAPGQGPAATPATMAGTTPAGGHSSTAPMTAPGQAPPATTGPTDPMALMAESHALAGGANKPPGTAPALASDPAAMAAAAMKAHAQNAGPGAANPVGAAANPAAPAGHAQASAAAPGLIPMPPGGLTPAPGGVSAPGGLGGAPGSGGGLGGQSFQPGSAEAAVAKFCAAMADSNLTEAGQYISPKAKGLLAQIRDGNITDEKIESLKASFKELTPKPSRPLGGVGKTLSLGNSNRESLSFTLMKEDDSYLLRELKITKVAR